MEETETDPHPLEAFSRILNLKLAPLRKKRFVHCDSCLSKRAEVCYLTPAIDTSLLEVEIRAVGRAVF